MGAYNDVVVTKVFDSETISASGDSSSGVVDLGSLTYNGNFGLQVYLSGNGTAQIDYTVSNHESDFITPTLASAITTGMTKTTGPGSDGKDAFSFEPILHRFLKVKVTETGTSDSITVTAYLATQ